MAVCKGYKPTEGITREGKLVICCAGHFRSGWALRKCERCKEFEPNISREWDEKQRLMPWED